MVLRLVIWLVVIAAGLYLVGGIAGRNDSDAHGPDNDQTCIGAQVWC